MKIFLYCDSDHEPSVDNVFLSGAYKDVGAFRRQNPGMRPLKSYDALQYMAFIQKILIQSTSKPGKTNTKKAKSCTN